MNLDSGTSERDIARFLTVLYYCGRPVSSLLDGETRQVDSIGQLQRFDFWVREPGHLALALLVQKPTPDSSQQRQLRRLVAGGQLDIRRIPVPSAPYSYLEDFGASMSFASSRALVSDRPSFAKSRSYGHRLVLETRGIALVKQILAECPSFDWYRVQSELVAENIATLDAIDLSAMPYLESELSPAQAAVTPLLPVVQARYSALYGENADAVV